MILKFDTRGNQKKGRADMATLKPGDKVQLKSGGPEMTVNRVVGGGDIEFDTVVRGNGYKDGDVHCQWFDKAQLKGEMFRADTLVII